MGRDTRNDKDASVTRPPSIWPAVRQRLESVSIILVFVLICATFTFSNEFFFTWENWYNLLRQSSINGILGIGLTYVILTGGIDLSVGSVMALAGMIAGSLVSAASAPSAGLGEAIANATVYPAGVGILAGLAVGLALGSVNGVLVTLLRVPPFVATLGILSMGRGMTLIFSKGRPIPDLSPSFRWMGGGTIVGLPVPVVILLATFIVGWVVLKFTTFGRYVIAVGGNERSARSSGISTRTIIFTTYLISGLLAGLGGLVLTARTTSALPQAGIGYELDAIAAVVIGGTSLSGGKGSLVGTLFGALIIATINNGMDLMECPPTTSSS